MSGRLSLLEQRIAWTTGLRATDKAVLLAMARWFCYRPDGTQIRFRVAALARKAGVPKRSAERALERLEAAWWIDVTARRRGSRQPTTYRIVLARLPTADPDALTPASVADERTRHPPEWRMNEADIRHSGGCHESVPFKNAPDSEKVADEVADDEVRTTAEAAVRTPAAADRTWVRQSGGRSGGRPEHPDVPLFLAWAAVTYPQHANGAHLVIDHDRDGHLIHGLLEHYPLERLQAMAMVCWTIAADDDPKSPASWIAQGDRSLRVLKHKAAFLERVVVGAQQLTFGPMTEQFTARELEDARHKRTHVYNGCPHDPRCEDYAACVREIAWYFKYGT